MDRTTGVVQKKLGKIRGWSLSWITFKPAQYEAYRSGFEAGKLRWPRQEAERAREATLDRLLSGPGKLRFNVTLGVLKLDQLLGVRAELRVGGRSWAPTQQAVDLVGHAASAEYTYDDPATFNYNEKGEMVSISPGFSHTDKIDYYWANLPLEFDLLEQGGIPRITLADESIQVRLTGPFGRLSATYKVEDIIKLVSPAGR